RASVRRARRVCPLFFFQAEDGIRDFHVTGVQTCALPIYQARYYIDASLAVPSAERQGRFAEAWTPAFLESMLLFFQRDCHFRIEIGRASCRERGWMSGVAV